MNAQSGLCEHIVCFNVKFGWVKLCISSCFGLTFCCVKEPAKGSAVTKYINKSWSGSFIISLADFILADI